MYKIPRVIKNKKDKLYFSKTENKLQHHYRAKIIYNHINVIYFTEIDRYVNITH